MVIISDPVSFLAAHSVSYLAAHHCNPPAQLSARLVNWFFDLFPFSCSPRPCFFLTAHHFLLGWSVHSPVGDSNPVECSKRWSQSTSTWAALPAEYFPSFFVSFFPARCSTNQWSSWKASSHSHLWNMWTSEKDSVSRTQQMIVALFLHPFLSDPGIPRFAAPKKNCIANFVLHFLALFVNM